MPRPRRTEHCWPVAHTLNDLLPLIPDPASFEVGSVLRIERIMLPEVHLLLVRQIAARFCLDNGWQTIYLVPNMHRAREVEAGVGHALVLHTHRNKKAVKRQLELVKLQAMKPLVVCCAASCVNVADGGMVEVALPVSDIRPSQCPACHKSIFIEWNKALRIHFVRCHHGTRAKDALNSFSQRISIRPSHQWGVVHPRANGRDGYRFWSESESVHAQELRTQGLSYAAIGEQLERSARSVEQHLRAGGIEGTRKRQQRRAYLDQFDI